jgi:hypothetical protein
MAIIHLEDAHRQAFDTGRTCQTIAGDDGGSIPVRVGIQTSPPAIPSALFPVDSCGIVK